MTRLKNFVAIEGSNLIYRAARYFGWDNDLWWTIQSAFFSLLGGFFGDAIAIALFPPLYIYRLVTGINFSLPRWVSDLLYFLRDVITPFWRAVETAVSRINVLWGNFTLWVANAIHNALAGWQDKINYVIWLGANLGSLFGYIVSNRLNWVYNLLPQWVKDALQSLQNLSLGILTWLANVKDEIQNFITNPKEYILARLPNQLLDVLRILTQDLNYLVWLFGAAKRSLVELVEDPTGWLEKNIMGSLLDVILDEVARKW